MYVVSYLQRKENWIYSSEMKKLENFFRHFLPNAILVGVLCFYSADVFSFYNETTLELLIWHQRDFWSCKKVCLGRF